MQSCGYARFAREVDDTGKETLLSFFGTDGTLVNGKGGYESCTNGSRHHPRRSADSAHYPPD
jgi:hypothetical protein